VQGRVNGNQAIDASEIQESVTTGSLLAVGHGPSGPEGRIFASGFLGAYDAAQQRTFTVEFRLSGFPVDRSTRVNFAGPTTPGDLK